MNPNQTLSTDIVEEVRERDLDFTPRTGTEFMNWVRDRYVWALGDQAVADLQLSKKKTKDDDMTEWLYMIMHPVVNDRQREYLYYH